MNHKLGLPGIMARLFLKSPITGVSALLFLLFGMIAVFFTAREENPQIDVPSGSVVVMYPGGQSDEVRRIITEPLERKLSEMVGVDHTYSMSMEGMGVVTVVFKVGQNKEQALVKLYDRVMQNMDMLPKDVLTPLVKPVDIDEVPIVTYALSSTAYNEAELYKVAQHLITPLSSVKDVSIVGIKGGHKRQFTIEVNPSSLASYGLSFQHIAQALKSANTRLNIGNIEEKSLFIPVEFDGFIRSIEDVKHLIIAHVNGKPLYLNEVASIHDSVNTQENISTLIGHKTNQHHQVTLYIAKKRGTNAVVVSEAIQQKMAELQPTLPQNIQLTLTRNDGEKANHAVNELIEHLLISVAIIVILLVFMLGWREALIVAFTIPLILGVTLFIGMLVGQTINRITLFALILALGLLVDDAIVVIENIHRRFSMGGASKEELTILASDEVGSPTIIATFAVILAFLPMGFVTGMMGPYMGPIPFNVPIAMLASLIIAYIFTPWLAYRFIPQHTSHEPFDMKNTRTYRFFNHYLRPMLEIRKKRYFFMGSIIVLFLASLALPAIELVLFKMLPSRDTNTFNITIDLPTGSSFQTTHHVAQRIGNVLGHNPYVTDYEIFVGTAGIIDFNGLLRGAGLKKGDNIAEIRVNLTDPKHRSIKSPEIVSQLRPLVQQCGINEQANIKLVEDPPGPPVQATLVSEIYGGSYQGRMILARHIENLYKETHHVVDTDVMADEPFWSYRIIPDQEKASLMGVQLHEITQTLSTALSGSIVSIAHISGEKEQVGIFLRLHKDNRSLDSLLQLRLPSSQGTLVPLNELCRIENKERSPLITSKDLRDVTFVTGETDKRGSLYAQLDIWSTLKNNSLSNYHITYDGNPRLKLHVLDKQTGEMYEIKFGGEWEITFDVFRDLGSAFGIAVILIYLLMVIYYKNFSLPGLVLAPVPLTFIGVLGGHWIMNLFTPTFFTATSMIGFIALAGIVVRNSILLIDFTKELLDEGIPLNDAILLAAATRYRPILLTALAIILASFVIVLDPVWQGLAVSLIFGVISSTILTLVVVPLLLFRRAKNRGGTL